MVEDSVIDTGAPLQAPPLAAQTLPAPPRRSRAGLVLGAAVVAFVLGAGLVGYAAWQGMLPTTYRAPAATTAPTPAQPALQAAPEASLDARQAGLEGRIGALEQRLDGLTAQADAAAGNASRAEALLVAFAARRALDRGAPLGYLEDQLRLRFADAQPHAVAAVIDAAHTPVTLDQLLAGLDSLAPTLTSAPVENSAWQRVKGEIASLFVIRRETAPSAAPQMMLERARILLEAGRTEDAMNEVRRLPGAAEAKDWLIAARHYDDTHHALDVLETAALLDTRAVVGAPKPAAPVRPKVPGASPT